MNFLFWLSVHWCKWGVKVPYYYSVTVDFPCYACQCLPYILRCPYVGCMNIYNCYVFFLNWSLDYYVVSLSLIIFFILKSILSEIRIATPTFFWFPSTCNIFFHPFTFSLHVSLGHRPFFKELCLCAGVGSWGQALYYPHGEVALKRIMLPHS